MFSDSALMLAQADEQLKAVSTGQDAAAILVLCVAASSIVMGTIWMMRISRIGHALPLARRDALRIPQPLLLVGMVLASLVLMLTLVTSLVELLSPEPPDGDAAAANATADGQQESAVPDTSADDAVTAKASVDPVPEDAAKPNAAAVDAVALNAAEADGAEADGAVSDDVEPERSWESMAPEEIVRTLVFNLEFTLVVLIGLGAAVYLANRPVPASASVPVSALVPDAPLVPVSSERVPTDDVRLLSAAPDTAASAEPLSVFEELRIAGEVFLAVWLPVTIVRMLIVMVSLTVFDAEPPQHPFFDMMKGDAGGLIILLIVLNAVVMAPIVEELQYRVVIFGGFMQSGMPMAGIVLSSLLFAGAHGIPDALALLPLAMALCYAYQRRRSWFTVAMIHFFFNAFNMSVALIGML